jgi:hypothetical protein
VCPDSEPIDAVGRLASCVAEVVGGCQECHPTNLIVWRPRAAH